MIGNDARSLVTILWRAEEGRGGTNKLSLNLRQEHTGLFVMSETRKRGACESE